MEYVIYAIVMLAISYALRPKPPTPKPATLSELDIPTAEQGRPVPVVFGTIRVRSPNVIWYGNMGVTKIKGDSK
jgi:hypothetical protein